MTDDDADDDDEDEDDDTDRYIRMFRMFLPAKELAEFLQQLDLLRPFLKTKTRAHSVREAVRLLFAAMTNEESSNKDDDEDDSVNERRLDAER